MIRRGPSLLRVAATTAVVAGTATAVSGGMRNRQAQKAQAQQAAAEPAAQAPAAPPAPTAGEMTDEVISQLKQLADLKNQGILTEEEFTAQKAKLLGE